MTFEQEMIKMLTEKLAIGVFMLLADKLLLGAVIGVFAFLAHKRLERYKAEQSLEAEIAKARIENIAKGWQALNRWDLAVNDVICDFAKFVRELDPQLQPDAGLDELGQPNLTAIANWLETHQDPRTLELIRGRCERELTDLLNESLAKSKNARAVMQENRFWFGKELYDHCVGFHAALHGVCTSFTNNDFKKLEVQLRELEHQRQDVLTTLQRIQSLPPRQPAPVSMMKGTT